MTVNPGLYNPRAVTDLAASIGHLFRVEVYPNGNIGGRPFDLAVEDVEVTMAEDWAPSVQVKVRAPLPADRAHLDALDPRVGCRLKIYAGYRYTGGAEDVQPLADVGLRRRPASLPEGVMELEAASDEARAQDARVSQTVVIPRTNLVAAIRAMADNSQPERTGLVSTLPSGTGAGKLDDMPVEIGDGYWDLMKDACARTQANIRLWCDETRTWRLSDRPQLSHAVKLELTVGQGGTIIDADTTLDREDWYNAVVLRYRWTDPVTKTEKIVYGRAWLGSGRHSVNTVGWKTYFEEIPRGMSAAGAANRATAILTTVSSRGQSVTLTTAAAYWLRPGDIVTVRLPGEAVTKYVVQSVTFMPLDGTMRLKLRMPSDTPITIGA